MDFDQIAAPSEAYEEIQINNAVNFEQLVNVTEDDLKFGQTIRADNKKYKKNISVGPFLPQWLKTVRDDLLAKHYSDFDLNNLKMIVVGSSGVDGYNSLRALVADDDFTGIPPAVKNFISYLNKAISSHSMNKGEITKHNANYDFRCSQSMEQVLFINVRHSRLPEDREWVNVACSIKFINKILGKKFNDKKSIAILDVRMSMDTHKDNAEASIAQDKNDKDENEYLQNEECFKIFNPNDYHRYVRLGNPGFHHFNQSDANFCVQQLRQLHEEGFPIDKLFEPKEGSKRKHEETPTNLHELNPFDGMFPNHTRRKTMRKNPKHSDEDSI